MKKIIFFIGLISQFSFSQIEKEVGDFNKVTSFDKIDVLLIPSNENKVILVGDNAEDVELVNKNGELKIRMPFTKLLKGDDISATVYYTNLDAIEANEGSRIASEATFEGTSFEVIAKENSEIKIQVNVSKINIRGGAGSNITVDGEADYQDVLLNSGALLFASKLITKQTTITVNAGGDADVYATDLVDAKVRAGGLITIFGNPKQINQKTIAGGRIEQVK